MKGYICPNKKCKEELHFEMIATANMRVCREREMDGHVEKVYNAYCPKCDEYMEVDARNRKIKTF